MSFDLNFSEDIEEFEPIKDIQITQKFINLKNIKLTNINQLPVKIDVEKQFKNFSLNNLNKFEI